MNRRTCACGATIVCADLDGWTIWLDSQPADDGLFQVVAGGDIPRVAVDPRGPYRRHTCAADPRPVDIDNTRTGSRLELSLRTAERTITAAQLVTTAQVPLPPRQQHITQLRIAHPDKSCRQLAALAGTTKSAVSSALHRIEQRAAQLNLGEAA